jgi:hypothetical protein
MPTDKRQNIKQIGVSTTIPERIKIYCDSRGERLQRQQFGCAESNGVKQQSLFCYLPLADHKDICTCQLREILSPQTTWCTFRADRPVTENSEQHLDVVMWPHIFLNVHLCS